MRWREDSGILQIKLIKIYQLQQSMGEFSVVAKNQHGFREYCNTTNLFNALHRTTNVDQRSLVIPLYWGISLAHLYRRNDSLLIAFYLFFKTV